MTKIRKSFRTTIIKTVTIEIDLDKLTPELISEYNSMITNKGETPEEHLQNIAEHHALENWWNGDMFLEGYGDLNEFDVKIIKDSYEEIETEEIDD
jgi:hypothetical protein